MQGKEDIRAAVKKLLNKYKVGRYYRLDIRDDGFDFELDETTMDADASRLANGNSELANKRLQRWSDTWGRQHQGRDKIVRVVTGITKRRLTHAGRSLRTQFEGDSPTDRRGQLQVKT